MFPEVARRATRRQVIVGKEEEHGSERQQCCAVNREGAYHDYLQGRVDDEQRYYKGLGFLSRLCLQCYLLAAAMSSSNSLRSQQGTRPVKGFEGYVLYACGIKLKMRLPNNCSRDFTIRKSYLSQEVSISSRKACTWNSAFGLSPSMAMHQHLQLLGGLCFTGCEDVSV